MNRTKRADTPGPYLRFCVMLLYPIVSAIWRRDWRGLDRIPRSGPAIVAINHLSYADPFVVGRAVWDAGRAPRFLAKAALFRAPVVGRILRGARQIPVYRGTSDADSALRGAVEALGRGEMVLIYPEGTVTRDPQFWPMQAKTGVARLALLAPEVPVIPIGQWGTHTFLDFYARRFAPLPRKTIGLSVGEPVDLSAFRGREPSAEVLHEMTDRIMRAVRDQVSLLRGEPAPTEFFPRPVGVNSRPRDARPDGGPKTRRSRS